MRILFITSTRIGDGVLSSGLLAALLQRHPEAELTIAAGPFSAPLFGAVPGLKRLIVMRKGKRAQHWRKLWWETVGSRWDLVVDLRASSIAWFLWARQRLVVGRKSVRLHRVEELAQLLGEDRPTPPRVWLAKAHRRMGESLVGEGPPVLALGPGANWLGKTWPPERFAELALRLTAREGPLPGGRIALFGGKDERQALMPLFDAVPQDRIIDLVGKVDLPVAAACLERCALYVGNDSGIMHLAAATGLPTLGLFGPTPEVRYRPWGDKAAYVRTPESYEEICALPGFHPSHPRCWMESLQVPEVEAAARELWTSQAAP